MREQLQELWHSDWQPVSRPAAYGLAGALAMFLIYAAAHNREFLFIDNVNLVVHEGGHLLFSWMGPALTLWGGTLLQWLAPLLLAAWFFCQRQPAGYAVCLFLFFENWLYTATYMADARAMDLPLVTVGDPEGGGHDWNAIFTSLGVLPYDTRIAAAVRFAGWVGMVTTIAWLVYRAHADTPGTTD